MKGSKFDQYGESSFSAAEKSGSLDLSRTILKRGFIVSKTSYAQSDVGI